MYLYLMSVLGHTLLFISTANQELVVQTYTVALDDRLATQINRWFGREVVAVGSTVIKAPAV